MGITMDVDVLMYQAKACSCARAIVCQRVTMLAERRCQQVYNAA
jgi:hypothetical protein